MVSLEDLVRAPTLHRRVRRLLAAEQHRRHDEDASHDAPAGQAMRRVLGMILLEARTLPAA
jgi:hypothetical protein